MSDLSAIAAISTPLGTGGVGIIRISGKNATEIADRDICILAEKGPHREYCSATSENGK